MKTLVFAGAVLGLALVGTSTGRVRPVEPPQPAAAPILARAAPDLAPADLTAVVQRYCQVCHNDQLLTGNLSLSGFDVARASDSPERAEKMITKLRAGMMPPPGIPRPGGDTLAALVETLEDQMNRAAAAHPNPGTRTFQRLNRAEYEQSIRDLLALEIRSGDFLPLDTKSANFDNIADVQAMSPTLLSAYLRAADEISRLAVGEPKATASEAQYRVSRLASQIEHVPGAPMGTRGGTAVLHNFPADGEYSFRVSFFAETTGTLVGNQRSALNDAENPEQLEISIDGERVALLVVDPWMHESDPTGVDMTSEKVYVRAGPHRVAAAFIQRLDGPVQDLVSPHEWSLASTAQAGEYGFLQLPHLKDVVIRGPYDARGVSQTPSRQKIFVCRPLAAAQAEACARDIVSRLASQAFRRPVKPEELAALMPIYAGAAAEEGFERGIQAVLAGILAHPQFVFRVEERGARARAGESYAIRDEDLASRLSFFLWGTPPDAELESLARAGKLADVRVLEAQARRMLADPRAGALGERFASQWLQLQDLEKISPDVRQYPDFYEQLRDDMLRETEVFFNSLVAEDRSMLDLFTADYSFMNERLARHYGIKGVAGEAFRRVQYPDDTRRGLLGHGSVLTLTSIANRTSPVLRGKWVMIAFLGTPPPPPPPGVPDLEATAGTEGSRMLTTRERMEIHRASPVCQSCHRFMDPIGLALDNFDVTGKWRTRENGMPLDTRGQLYDGTAVQSPSDLTQALLRRPIPLVRNFTKNLMAYAIGRRVEYYDQPTIRAVAADAETNGYRMSSFILGVIKSDAFRMKLPTDVTTTTASAGER